MRKRFTYNKFLIASIFVLMMNMANGAFIGNTDDHKNKFSLSNLNSLTRLYTLSPLRSNTFQYKGSQEIYRFYNGVQAQSQSIIRMERGNTTYVYPYRYTVKVPKFKTPVAPLIR